MDSLDKIENKLDKQIYKILVELKIEAMANMIYEINARKDNEQYALDICVNEKSVRRDFHYSPEMSIEGFSCRFTNQTEETDESINLKRFMKEAFTFAITYKPLEIDELMEVFIEGEKYDSNQFLNQIANSSFFYQNPKKTPKKIFKQIVELLEQKGENVSIYQYILPVKTYNPDREKELQDMMQAINTRDMLFEKLTNVKTSTTTHKKI